MYAVIKKSLYTCIQRAIRLSSNNRTHGLEGVFRFELIELRMNRTKSYAGKQSSQVKAAESSALDWRRVRGHIAHKHTDQKVLQTKWETSNSNILAIHLLSLIDN